MMPGVRQNVLFYSILTANKIRPFNMNSKFKVILIYSIAFNKSGKDKKEVRLYLCNLYDASGSR